MQLKALKCLYRSGISSLNKSKFAVKNWNYNVILIIKCKWQL